MIYLKPESIVTLAGWCQYGEGMAAVRIEPMAFRPGTADVRVGRAAFMPRMANGFIKGVLVNQGDEYLVIDEDGNRYEGDEEGRWVRVS